LKFIYNHLQLVGWLLLTAPSRNKKHGSLRARMQDRRSPAGVGPADQILVTMPHQAACKVRTPTIQSVSAAAAFKATMSAQEAPARSPGGSAANGQAQGARFWAPEAGGAAKPEENN
jgi:hypothetical protein